MHSLIRRLRGHLGLGVFSGVTWASLGLVIGTVVLLVDPASVDAGEGPFWIAYYFGRAGFVAGVASAAIIALAERRRSILSVSRLRVALWGAAAGFSLPWVAFAPAAMLPFFVVLGAGTALTALGLARRGERLAVADAGEPAASIGARG